MVGALGEIDGYLLGIHSYISLISFYQTEVFLQLVVRIQTLIKCQLDGITQGYHMTRPPVQPAPRRNMPVSLRIRYLLDVPFARVLTISGPTPRLNLNHSINCLLDSDLRLATATTTARPPACAS